MSATEYLLEIERITNHFRLEFDMTYAELIGCLEIFKQDIHREMDGAKDE